MSLLGRCSGSRHDGPAAGLLIAIATTLVLAGAVPASTPAYRLVAWGSNQSGQLGNGSSGEDVDGAVLVRGRATSVAAGANHSLALRPSGRVAAWGGNEAGQVGDGTTGRSSVAVAVSRLRGVTAIAAGARFALALLGDGTVMAWGDNRAGELGDGTTDSSDVPVESSGLSGLGVTAIS